MDKYEKVSFGRLLLCTGWGFRGVICVLAAVVFVTPYRGSVELHSEVCSGALIEVNEKLPKRRSPETLLAVVIETEELGTCGAQWVRSHNADYFEVKNLMFSLERGEKYSLNCVGSNYFSGCAGVVEILDKNLKLIWKNNKKIVEKSVLEMSSREMSLRRLSFIALIVLIIFESLRIIFLRLGRK